MSIIRYLIWFFPILILYLAVHETGHYLCGRYLSGISKHSIKIVLNRNPAHVAIKDKNGAWVEPGEEMDSYISAYNHASRKDKDYSFWFIQAGFIFQTIVFVIVSIVFNLFISRSLAVYMMVFSAILTSVYILFDLIILKTQSVPYGDTGVAILMSKTKTIVFLLVIVLTYLLFFTFI